MRYFETIKSHRRIIFLSLVIYLILTVILILGLASGVDTFNFFFVAMVGLPIVALAYLVTTKKLLLFPIVFLVIWMSLGYFMYQQDAATLKSNVAGAPRL